MRFMVSYVIEINSIYNCNGFSDSFFYVFVWLQAFNSSAFPVDLKGNLVFQWLFWCVEPDIDYFRCILSCGWSLWQCQMLSGGGGVSGKPRFSSISSIIKEYGC